MEPPFVLLEQAKTLLLQKKLSPLAHYEKSREDSEAAWKQFCLTHTAQIRDEVLELLDRRDGMWDLRQDAAFCLGLQLGMELGRREEFWGREP